MKRTLKIIGDTVLILLYDFFKIGITFKIVVFFAITFVITKLLGLNEKETTTFYFVIVSTFMLLMITYLIIVYFLLLEDIKLLKSLLADELQKKKFSKEDIDKVESFVNTFDKSTFIKQIKLLTGTAFQIEGIIFKLKGL